jgi:hypothetical protein
MNLYNSAFCYKNMKAVLSYRRRSFGRTKAAGIGAGAVFD